MLARIIKQSRLQQSAFTLQVQLADIPNEMPLNKKVDITNSLPGLQEEHGDGWSAFSLQYKSELHPGYRDVRQTTVGYQHLLHVQRNGKVGLECCQLFVSVVTMTATKCEYK
jgi:hypothetical protein